MSRVIDETYLDDLSTQLVKSAEVLNASPFYAQRQRFHEWSDELREAVVEIPFDSETDVAHAV